MLTAGGVQFDVKRAKSLHAVIVHMQKLCRGDAVDNYAFECRNPECALVLAANERLPFVFVSANASCRQHRRAGVENSMCSGGSAGLQRVGAGAAAKILRLPVFARLAAPAAMAELIGTTDGRARGGGRRR